MPKLELISVNCGDIRQHQNARGYLPATGLHKRPTSARLNVSKAGMQGDASAYRSRSLGDTAIHLYSAESYQVLASKIGKRLPIPCFGENLTVAGYPESQARIGDVLRIGSVTLQVNQPVVRCSWPTTLAGDSRLTKWATAGGFTGIYLHVLTQGQLQLGDKIELIERGDSDFTIAKLNHILQRKRSMPAAVSELLNNPLIASRWKDSLRR